MARQQRSHIPGVLHYIVLQAGIERKNTTDEVGPAEGQVFLDDEERHEFVRRLQGALAATRVRLHGYCLTPTDVRLLAEPTTEPLGKFVRHACTYFAHWVNKRRGREGHLFRQRYHAVPITDRALLRSVARHLHRTPLAAQIVQEWEGYRWSSHHCYLGVDPVPWLTTHRILRTFALDPSHARDAYQRYVAAQDPPRHDASGIRLESPPEDFCSGDGAFVRWLTQQLRDDDRAATVEQIVHATCRRMGIEEVELVSASRVPYLSLARAVVAWQATRSGVATYAQVGEYLHRDPSTLYYGCERYEHSYPQLFGLGLEEFLSVDNVSTSQRGGVLNAPAEDEEGLAAGDLGIKTPTQSSSPMAQASGSEENSGGAAPEESVGAVPVWGVGIVGLGTVKC